MNANWLWLVISIVWEPFAECRGGGWGDPKGLLPSSEGWPPGWTRAELMLLVVTSPFVNHGKAVPAGLMPALVVVHLPGVFPR